MPLESVGGVLRTVGGGPFRINGLDLTEPARVNKCPSFSSGLWILAGGATIDAEGVLTLPSTTATATSPALPTEALARIYVAAEAYSDVQSPYGPYQPNASRLYNSTYWADQAMTVAKQNIDGYTGNGSAASFAKSQWVKQEWSMNGHAEIQYVKWQISGSNAWSSTPIKYRNPQMSGLAMGNPLPAYRPYYRQGL